MSPIFKALKRQGLTLIEMIITIVLFTFLLSAVSTIYHSIFKPYYSQEKRAGIKAEAARSLWKLAADLRQATSLTTAQATNLTLKMDTDNNGVDETIQYTWSGVAGDSLDRVADVTTPLVNSIDSLEFSYYDANSNELSSPVSISQVRMVAVDLTTKSGDETFQLRSQTRLRNFS